MAETDFEGGAGAPQLPEMQTTNGPQALLDGVDQAVCQVLGVKSLRHRSALLDLCRQDHLPTGAVNAAYAVIAANWRHCRGARTVVKSTANWRWRVPQLAIAPQNRSPEVVLERAVVGACARLGRSDWSNQVPVASGIAGSSRERRRAIDLVQERAASRFQLIELKIASDNPLFAAFEIISYTCIWLLSRAEADRPQSPLLTATEIDARVLAPRAYYARYDLHRLTALLDQELRALGCRYRVELSFGFDTFTGDMPLAPYPDEAVIALVDQRGPI